jgi:transposase-like protein
MNVHKNARLTPLGRERIVRQVASGQTPEAVAEAAGVCPRTVRKWVDRYRCEGLQDRSSRPHRLRRPTPQAVVDQIEKLRRQRWTGKQIAAETGVSPATVSRVLRRLGLNQLSALEPAEPIRRYERENPGELIHIDIKKLGRIGSVGHRITGRQPGMVNRHLGITFGGCALFVPSDFDLTQKLLSAAPFILADCEGDHARRLDHLRGIWRSRVSTPVAGSNTVEG